MIKSAYLDLTHAALQKFFDMLASDEGKETKAASTPGKAALAMVGNGIRQALSEQPPGTRLGLLDALLICLLVCS